MPGVGIGGLLSSLFNPGLDERVVQGITPNPNPLAQQGQGPQPPGAVDSLGNPVRQPGPAASLAPSASTQPDPINAPNVAKLSQPDPSYAANLYRVHQLDALSADLNRNIEGIAAGFGTAEQQAAKQRALGAGGGVGDSLGALAKIQAMQDQTIQDNEHARFMANAAVFAQTLSQSLGRPVSVQEATEIMNSPDLMKQFSVAAGANMQTPDKLKEADAEARAWVEAHAGDNGGAGPTPAEIAQHKSDFLAQTAGGLSTVGKQLAEDRRNWMAAHKGATFQDMIADRPDLADETTYVTTKQEQAKVGVAAGLARQDNKEALPNIESNLKPITDNLEDILKANPDDVVTAIKYPEIAGGPIGRVGEAIGAPNAAAAAISSKVNQLQKQLQSDAMHSQKNIRTQNEFNAVGAAASSIFDPRSTPEQIKAGLQQLRDKFNLLHQNALAAAGHEVDPEYATRVDSDYLNPRSSLYNGATVRNDFRKMSHNDADKAYEALPSGASFMDTDGVAKKKP